MLWTWLIELGEPHCNKTYNAGARAVVPNCQTLIDGKHLFHLIRFQACPWRYPLAIPYLNMLMTLALKLTHRCCPWNVLSINPGKWLSASCSWERRAEGKRKKGSCTDSASVHIRGNQRKEESRDGEIVSSITRLHHCRHTAYSHTELPFSIQFTNRLS